MIQDPTWAVPLARAYKRLVHRQVPQGEPAAPARVALVPIQDVPEAVKELRRAVTELGMVGAVLGRERRGARRAQAARRSFVLAAV